MSIDSYSRCFLLVVHHRGSRRGGRGARARRPGQTQYWCCQYRYCYTRLAPLAQYWDRTDKIGIIRTGSASHPWELMLLLCCLFSTSTTSATGLNVIPAGVEAGAGRDGVAGARPFRADTLKLGFVGFCERVFGTWEVEVTVMGRSF